MTDLFCLDCEKIGTNCRECEQCGSRALFPVRVWLDRQLANEVPRGIDREILRERG